MVNATSKEVVPVDNNGAADEPKVLCIVKDETTTDWKRNLHTVNLPASTLVKELFSYVAKAVNYVEDTFLLVWNKIVVEGNEEVVLNGEKDRTLQDVGLATNGKKNNFLIRDKDNLQPTKTKVSEPTSFYRTIVSSC